MLRSLVGSEMCIRDSHRTTVMQCGVWHSGRELGCLGDRSNCCGYLSDDGQLLACAVELIIYRITRQTSSSAPTVLPAANNVHGWVLLCRVRASCDYVMHKRELRHACYKLYWRLLRRRRRIHQPYIVHYTYIQAKVTAVNQICDKSCLLYTSPSPRDS